MSDRKVTSWVYRTYPLATSATAFGPFRDFVALWLEKRGSDRPYPAWTDFQLEDFRDWYGQLSLGEVQYDPFDLFYRLWGTRLVDWWNYEMTGKCLSEYPWAVEVWKAIERPTCRNS